MRLTTASLLFAAASAFAADPPLTLDEALAAADAAHPLMQAAQADLDLALADERIAASSNDAMLVAEGVLRRGRPTVNGDDWRDDHLARLTLRKTLFDFGRQRGQVEAAREEANARRLALMDTRDARRIDVMARFFDVLLADMRYAVDNEHMAVLYVRWDDSRKRYDLGELTASQLAELEARFQDMREKRNQSLFAQRATRQRLANALNQPGRLPATLAPPKLAQNDLPLPDYEALLPLALESNRKVLALKARLNAVAARTEAIRAGRAPSVDVEVMAGDYSRDATTRDRLSGGLILNWPLYQGRASTTGSPASWPSAHASRRSSSRRGASSPRACWKPCRRSTGCAIPRARRRACRSTTATRCWTARAEYELEMRTNLGQTMAETQAAALRASEVEYRLALALARLEALVGRPLAEFATQTKLTENR